ncbi:MAG: P-II family nitrogen regulator [Verrucomicrobiales bacterium]|nr:P-II family nitrogen regulator [Verrucomicrobiales bacterium]
MAIDTLSGYSRVTAILPRQSTLKVLKEVMDSGAAHAMTTGGRGSIIQENWYQSLLPTLSPEHDMLRFLAPTSDTDHLMEQIALVGNLRHYGGGSIFATPCLDLSCSETFPVWHPGEYTFESVSFDIVFKQDLTAIILVTDRNSADGICRAAIKAGAQGPSITFVRGYGLRDRLGLLRITKSHDKEMITVVVDKYDLDAIFQAMAQAGRVDQPGRGLIYQVPISKGLTNLASVFQARKHSASIQQIIRAIDDLQGNTDWRANQLLIHDPKAEEFAANTQGVTKNLISLNVIARRKDVEMLLQYILGIGVKGASVSNWRLIEGDAAETKGGSRINHEVGCLTMLVPRSKSASLVEQIRDRLEENDYRGSCIFSTEVPVAKTFTKMA